jgi:hypothetical protein
MHAHEPAFVNAIVEIDHVFDVVDEIGFVDDESSDVE